MILKGSATIELTDADGSKKVIKHDNMITSAVSDMLTSVRGEMPMAHKIANARDSYVKTLFGGIFLFDKVMSDDPNDYYFPSLDVVGYSSHDVHSGDDAKRGIFNSVESGLQDDGSYKLVYDFSTSQGNGNIQSLGLAPNLIGRIGATEITPNSTDRVASDYAPNGTDRTPKLFSSKIYDQKLYDGSYTTSFTIVGIVGEIIYVADSIYNSSTKNLLKLSRLEYSMQNVGLGSSVSYARYIDTIEITYPAEFANQLTMKESFYFDNVENKLYVFPSNMSGLAPNASCRYIDIDLLNGYTITQHTFTNTSLETLDASYQKTNLTNSEFQLAFCASKDYVVFMTRDKADSSQRHLYVAKANNNTEVVRVFDESGDYVSSNGYFGMSPIGIIGNYFLFANNSNLSIANSSANLMLIDLRTGKLKRTNATRTFASYYMGVNSVNKCWYWSCTKEFEMTPKIVPFILTTKNNLDTPVVKTASQTMKITYTLRESEGV